MGPSTLVSRPGEIVSCGNVTPRALKIHLDFEVETPRFNELDH